MECKEHKFVFIRNESYYTWVSRYSLQYVSIDYFFCEKCLQYEQVKKEATVSNSMADQLPDWAKGITRKISSEYSL